MLPPGDGGRVGLWIAGTGIRLVETDELMARRASFLLVRACLDIPVWCQTAETRACRSRRYYSF